MDLQQDAVQKTNKGAQKLLSYTIQAAKLTEEIFKMMLGKAAKGRSSLDSRNSADRRNSSDSRNNANRKNSSDSRNNADRKNSSDGRNNADHKNNADSRNNADHKNNADNSKNKYSTTTVAAMAANGRKLTGVEDVPEIAKRFYKSAGKQGIALTMLQDKSTNPPTFHLCIYKGQESMFNRLAKNFLNEEAQRKLKPSLRQKLQAKVKEAKEQMSQLVEKVKQERSR